MVFYHPVCSPISKVFKSNRRSGIPGSPIASFLLPDLQDTIGLSIRDYNLIGATWQPIFFTDVDTPIVFDDFAALYASVSVVDIFNTENVMGTEAKGIAVYRSDTSREILNRALRWFGLQEIVETQYWQRVDGSSILRTDESKIEVF